MADSLEKHEQNQDGLSVVLALDEILYTTPIEAHLGRLERNLDAAEVEKDPELWGLVSIARARSLRRRDAGARC